MAIVCPLPSDAEALVSAYAAWRSTGRYPLEYAVDAAGVTSSALVTTCASHAAVACAFECAHTRRSWTVGAAPAVGDGASETASVRSVEAAMRVEVRRMSA